jgi:hypothetical protein
MNPLHALQEAIHFSFIKFRIYCFPLWYEFFVHYALRVEKNYHHGLDGNLWNSSSFGRGDISTTHPELCRFVSGSYAKHHVSSPVVILLKIFLSASAIAIVSWQDVTLSSLCSCVKECGIKRAHNFLFPKFTFRVRRTTVLGMFIDSAIILDAIRWSLLTKTATAAMFISVSVDFGRPPLSSSFTRPLPSRNREYHLKTFDRFRASFP